MILHRLTIVAALILATSIFHARAAEPIPESPSFMAPPASHTGSDAIRDAINEITRTDPAPMSVWDRIRGGFAMPALTRSEHRQPARSTARAQDVELISQRAEPYLYHVVEEVERRRMPMEIALIPFIESAFNPHASSQANAAGLWQFVPSTGLAFNLRQNRYIDERRDVVASTDAALNYLQYLHQMFGDWQLALTAYNWGEGSLQRAIHRNRSAGKPADYASLAEQMPPETRAYLPKLQAVKNIVSRPESFGISLADVRNEPYFTPVEKHADIDVMTAAALADMPMQEFSDLNPQFKTGTIRAAGGTRVLVPMSKAATFRENLVRWRENMSSWAKDAVSRTGERIRALRPPDQPPDQGRRLPPRAKAGSAP